MAGRPKQRSSVPISGNFRHGSEYGYSKGCGCDACTEANTEKKRKRTLARTGREPVRAVGKFERGARALIAEIGAKGAEAELLADMMVFNAQILDSIPGNGRYHLANSAQKAMHECREELHKLAGGVKPAGSDPVSDLEGFLSGLTQQG